MSMTDVLFDCGLTEGDLDDFPALLKARFPFGSYLVLTDEESALALGNALKRVPKKLMLVLKREEDILPLFSVSDGITCVIGAGSAAGAARYFACARSLPFVAVCLSCLPAGVLDRTAEVSVNGTRAAYPVPLPKLAFFDGGRAAENGRGIFYALAFLLASEFSLFSEEAARLLGLSEGEREKETEALLFAACAFSDVPFAAFKSADAHALFRAALTAKYCFRSGFPEGEAFGLSLLLEKISGVPREAVLFSCTKALADLYALFFDGGFYRGGKVDYNARFARASELAAGKEITVNNINIPTAEQLKARAAAFEKNKTILARRASDFCAKAEKIGSAFAQYVPEADGKIGEIMRFLPEFSPDSRGITTLMRDFSLL